MNTPPPPGSESPPTECAALARAPRILDLLAEDLERSGLARGRIPAAQLVYLAVASRLGKRPVSVVVKGPSSAGKSWLLGQVLDFFPASAYRELTAMSDKALAYSKVPLKHRMLILYEAQAIASETANYLVRSLISEGRLHYEYVTESGQAKTIDKEGPTGLISTTTAFKLHAENETRFLSVPVGDSQDERRDVLRRWGADAAGGDLEPVNLAPWRALDGWHASSDWRAMIPFGRELGELVPTHEERVQRDFIHLLTLVCTHALLHRSTRGRDEKGRVEASLDDYAVVRGLVEPLLAQETAAAVKPQVRETVEAVNALAPEHPDGVPQLAIVERLALHKAVASRRVGEAKNAGYLRDEEDRRGRPSRLVLADPMPTDAPVLPAPEAVARLHSCTVAGVQGQG